MTNILVCGLLWSGSSAVVDLLKEYECVGLMDGEFDEFRRPGKVGDHLAGLISEYYPSTLEVNKTTWIKRALKKQIKAMARLTIDRPPKCLIKDWRELSALDQLVDDLRDSKQGEQQRINAARLWLSRLKDLHAKEKDYFVLDQPILWGQHFNIWPKIMDPFKMVVVIRDPRDQLAETIRKNHLFLHFRSPEADIYGGGRKGAVKYFIHTLRCRIEHFQKIRESLGEGKIFTVKFEDLAQNPDSATLNIERFLGMNNSCSRISHSHFEPWKSRNNIGIYEEYLTESECGDLGGLLDAYEKFYSA